MRILFALDDSVKAQEEVLRLTHLAKADLTVLFVRDVSWNMFLCHDWLLGSDARADFMDWMREEEGKSADVAILQFRERAGDTPFTEKIVEGDVREQILLEAGNNYDLLVLANPFFRGLERVRKAVPAIVEAQPCNIMLINR